MLKVWSLDDYSLKMSCSPDEAKITKEVRFGKGFVMFISMREPSQIMFEIWDPADKTVLQTCLVKYRPGKRITSLELFGANLIFKQAHCKATVIDLLTGVTHQAEDSEAFEPNSFVALKDGNILAMFDSHIEVRTKNLTLIS